MSVAIVGAGAVTAAGLEWRGLGAALAEGASYKAASRRLAAAFPGTVSCEIDELPQPVDSAERMARRRMSRGAVLSTIATRAAIADAGWDGPLDDVGFYMGVGASGGEVDQLEALLEASIVDGELSMERFGSAGLRACNPLYTFQLMNNFTLCHAAILAGTRGPNGAFFSRGGGTTAALDAAIGAIELGDCTRCLAGGADSAIHGVTWNELLDGGYAAEGMVPAEGAGVVALAASAERPLAVVDWCARYTSCTQLPAELREADRWGDVLVAAAWSPDTRMMMQAWLYEMRPRARVVDVCAGLGDALAATPALAWIAAIDALHELQCDTALVLTVGVDGELGAVRLRRTR